MDNKNKADVSISISTPNDDEVSIIDKVRDINKRFKYVDKICKMVINGITPSLVITGEGALGKTYTVKKALNKDLFEEEYNYVKGYSTARGLYNTLYDNKDTITIFDDCDSVLEDKVALNILKAALDSYDERVITWNARMAKNDVYPKSFKFTGSIIFISNKDRKKLDKALLSRGYIVDLSMTNEEKILRMKHIIKDVLPKYKMKYKKDALDFIIENKDNLKDLNIRTLINVSKIRKANSKKDWKDLALYTMLDI